MLLQRKEDGVLVKVVEINDMINPIQPQVMIRVQAGEEEQDAEMMEKCDLTFPSGENLPICWTNPDYRKQ
ncbi:acetyltransferase [Alkalinema pantanalense CENA528]|uniref:acetyltransferase n=1 Tax=Alkalinema pantanalense TaxID=1620705 RepID=UPI003D6FCCCD